MARNYRSEYDSYHSSPEQKKRRASRNAARRRALKDGKVAKGDGKDIAHKNGNPLDNRSSNLKPQPKAINRSFKRTKTARKVNPRD